MIIRVRARDGELAAKLPELVRALERMSSRRLSKAVKPDGKPAPRVIQDLQTEATAHAERIRRRMAKRIKEILDEPVS